MLPPAAEGGCTHYVRRLCSTACHDAHGPSGTAHAPRHPVSLEGRYATSDTIYDREIMNGEEARYFWQEVHDWLAAYLSE